jgi:hypothetical protein
MRDYLFEKAVADSESQAEIDESANALRIIRGVKHLTMMRPPADFQGQETYFNKTLPEAREELKDSISYELTLHEIETMCEICASILEDAGWGGE